MDLTNVILPELILIIIACGLFLLGISSQVAARRAAAMLALIGVVTVIVIQGAVIGQQTGRTIQDFSGAIEVGPFANFIKLITGVVGVILVLLAWPTNRDATGSRSLLFGHDAGEFYGLMLLAMAGLMLVADSNDLVLLFLGIELASIPTYIMVSISRPIPAAQEAGVKYFFLGALAAAVMLFGFSYLYGTTGLINLHDIGERFRSGAATPLGATNLSSWQTLAILLLVAGFAFKIAAVPLHFYAGDVYQGAATPVTAFLSFVPKTSGMVALIKLLYVAGGNSWASPLTVQKLMWILAVLTMSVGNTLGLLQFNIKRVFAYSSIAHSGYMLVGLAALTVAPYAITQENALQGVLFYLAAYGIMNAGAFGVLMLLPARQQRSWSGAIAPAPPPTSAETFEDIAGQGRRHPVLGLAMAVCCFSLIGLPLTVGFFGKLYLIKPALDGHLYGLVVIMMINAAVSAAYYLKIVATMFLRPEPDDAASHVEPTLPASVPIRAAIVLSVFGTLLFGTMVPATQLLINQVTPAAQLEAPSIRGTPTASTASR
jgi:NADH-quinone oxidoreductase subunit N